MATSTTTTSGRRRRSAPARRLAVLVLMTITLTAAFSAAIVTRDDDAASPLSLAAGSRSSSSAASSPSTAASPSAPVAAAAAPTAAAPAAKSSSKPTNDDERELEETEALAAAAVQVTESEEGRGGGVRDYSEEELENVELPPSLFEVEDRDSLRGRRQNYASLDAGATILDSAPETKSPTNLLVPDKDRYMLIPCEKPRKWVVVSLSEDVHADAIALANFEKFSSPVKDFIVLGSVTYPTDTWFVLGNFTAAHASGEQVFQLDSQSHVRYIKLRFFSHYGSEYYCTLSQLKVFGRTFTQVISQLEKSIDAEGALDSVALPVPPVPTTITPAVQPNEVAELPSGTKSDADASTSTPRSDGVWTDRSGASTARADKAAAASGLCHVVSSPVNSTMLVLYDAAQLEKYWNDRGLCRLDDSMATTTVADAASSPDGPKSAAESPAKAVDPFNVDAAVVVTSDADTNATVASSSPGAPPDAANANAIKANTTPAATTVHVATSGSVGTSPQGLGRLESIFVRITKKIQALELNQSVFGRQMEEFQAQQRVATHNLQATQDLFTEQLKEIRALLTDLKGTVSKEMSGTEKTLDRYGRILEEVQRENIALWNEMLIVREVITTMKAGILCAIVLSAFIIAFYLLRLLFRCVAACKQRADLREWFWRMENQASVQDAGTASPSKNGARSGTKSPTSDVEAGVLRVNRKQQFGSSWDDSAIERKTLMSDMVDGPQKFRRHRSKKSRTASLTYGPTIQRIVK